MAGLFGKVLPLISSGIRAQRIWTFPRATYGLSFPAASPFPRDALAEPRTFPRTKLTRADDADDDYDVDDDSSPAARPRAPDGLDTLQLPRIYGDLAALHIARNYTYFG